MKGDNRFRKLAGNTGNDILNAGKSIENENKIEEQSNRETEDIVSINDPNDYYSYKRIRPQNAKISKTSDKYKVNYSFPEETLQKFQHMFINEFAGKGIIDNKEYSTIAIKAVELLYEVNFELNKKGISIFGRELDPKMIIEYLKSDVDK